MQPKKKGSEWKAMEADVMVRVVGAEVEKASD